MINRLKITAFLCCFHILLFAQVKTIDSLENLLKQHPRKDSARINLLNTAAYEYRRTDIEKGYLYALEADSLSDALNFRKGKAESQRMIGRYFRSKGDFSSALEYAQKGLKINEEIRYKTGIAYCLGDISAVYIYLNNYSMAENYVQKALKQAEEILDYTQMTLYLLNLGVIYQKMGDYPKALDYYQTGLKIAEEINDRYSVNSYYGNLGTLYQAQGNYPMALEYYQKSLNLCEASNDQRGICYASANIGEIYIYQENYVKALDYLLKSMQEAEAIRDKYMALSCISLIGNIYIELNDYSQALSYLQKGLSSSQETGMQSITSQILVYIGFIHENRNNLSEALEYYQKALKISEEIGEKKSISEIYRHIGAVYFKRRNYVTALDYTNKSLAIANDLKLQDNQSEIVLQLSDIYGAIGNFQKAYNTYRIYKQLNDSVFNKDKTKKMADLEAMYKYEKERQATELEQQKKDEVKALQLRRQKFIAYSAGLVVILMAFIAFLLYRNNRQQKKAYAVLKATQSQLIHTEKMASLGEITAGIAHEIQNPLNFVNNFAEVSNQMVDEMKDELSAGMVEKAVELANDIKLNLEKIYQHGMRAGTIVKGMLQHSWAGTGNMEPSDINSLADEFLRLTYHGFKAKDDTINIQIKSDYDETLSGSKGKISIFPQEIGRVIRNLLSNAFYAVLEKRKGQPEGYTPSVLLSTKRIGDKVEIKVRDNGNGIPPQIIKKIFQPFTTTKPAGQGTGLGLSISYDIIVHQHHGQISFKTGQGNFTEFQILLPFR